jgi:histidine ammonia-lyase
MTPEAKLGHGTAEAHRRIRRAVPFIEQDQLYGPYVEALAEMVRESRLESGER